MFLAESAGNSYEVTIKKSLARGIKARYNKGGSVLSNTNAAKVIEKGSGFMPSDKNRVYTIEDIENLPEGERAELIDGKIYYMSSPRLIHQRLLGELHARIYNYIKSKNGPCEVFFAPLAVYINKDKHNYVEPDISVICDKTKLDERGCNGAPDWVIEIVSPSSRQMDYYRKLFKYSSAGVREYWIVDPQKNRVLVYNFESEEIQDYTFADTVKAGIYDDFYIDFSEMPAET